MFFLSFILAYLFVFVLAFFSPNRESDGWAKWRLALRWLKIPTQESKSRQSGKGLACWTFDSVKKTWLDKSAETQWHLKRYLLHSISFFKVF